MKSPKLLLLGVVVFFLSLATWTLTEGYEDLPPVPQTDGSLPKDIMPSFTKDDAGNWVDQNGNIVGPDDPNCNNLESPGVSNPMVQVMPVIFADGTSQMIPISGQQPPMAWVPGKDEMNMGNIPPWMLPQVPGMGMGGMGMMGTPYM